MPTPDTHKAIAARAAALAADLPTPEQAKAAEDAAKAALQAAKDALAAAESAARVAAETLMIAGVMPQILKALQTESGCAALDTVARNGGSDNTAAVRRGWMERKTYKSWKGRTFGYSTTKAGEAVNKTYRKLLED
jgi:hypothetical protein